MPSTIKCAIIDKRTEKPVEEFAAGAERCVNIDNLEQFDLQLLVRANCFMQVRADEQVIHNGELPPGQHRFPLSQLLEPKKKPRSLFFFPGTSDKSPEAISVVVRQKDASGSVLGTFDYRLLQAREFESRFRNYLQLVEPRGKHEFFTTDARRAETAINCWNCQAALKTLDTCKRCGCSQERD